MSFTDQKPNEATERQVKGWGGKREAGKRFRCYLCGYKFKVGDIWRWVNTPFVCGLINFIVCEKCDGEDVVDKWLQANSDLKKAKERFWWYFN